MAKKSSGWSRFASTISGTRNPFWQKTLRWLLFLAASGFVLGVLALVIAYKAIDIPKPNSEFLTQTTTIYYSDGQHELGKLANQDRESIPLSDVPEAMQDAMIAAEDRSFWDNQGIDIRGIIRALRDNASSGEITGGGSTITQQYVKILYLTQERTYTRKAKEAVLALKVHNQLSKKEILEGYLNTVYYGNRAYRVEVAAQTSFHKPAKELTIPESAALAAIINIPSSYDPYREGGKERLLPRYNYVLDGMEKAGDITSAEAEQFRGNLPVFAEKTYSQRYSGPNGYLIRLVEQQMRQLGYPDSEIEGAGLRITTTIDYDKQVDAIAAIDSINKQTGPRAFEQGLHRSLVSVEPGTGAVRAMYGGADFLKSEVNWTLARTQPGSTFKVFGLVAGLENGYSLKTKLNGSSPQTFGPDATIENQGDSGGRSYGIIDLTKATQNSVNTAFVDLVGQIGDGSYSQGSIKVKETAQKLGIPESTVEQIDNVMVAVLGYAPVAPIDMATAYATIGAGGVRADWYLIEKVSTRDGGTRHEHEVEAKRVISEKVAGDALVAMQAVVNGGTGKNAASVCPIAGKTGTATAGVGKNQHVSSSWFIGTSPKLTTAVMQNRGVGNEDLEQILGSQFIGGGYPAKGFRAFMNKALDPKDCGKFVPPGNIKSTKGNTLSSTPTAACPDPNTHLENNACVPNPPAVTCPNPVDPSKTVLGPDGNCYDPADKNMNGTTADDNCPPGTTWNGSACAPNGGGGGGGQTDWSQYNNQATCVAAGGRWTGNLINGSCGPP